MDLSQAVAGVSRVPYQFHSMPSLSLQSLLQSALEFLGELSTSVFIARIVSGVAEELCGLRLTASLLGDDFAADFNTMGVKEAATEGGPEPSGGGGVSCSLSISLNAFSLASVYFRVNFQVFFCSAKSLFPLKH